eukprot:768651-Hanusia_phi.AAC.5
MDRRSRGQRRPPAQHQQGEHAGSAPADQAEGCEEGGAGRGGEGTVGMLRVRGLLEEEEEREEEGTKEEEEEEERVIRWLIDEAKKSEKDYEEFYKNFGLMLKEGVAMDQKNAPQLAKLLRYPSSAIEQDEITSLDAYVSRMKEGQDTIYYLVANSYNVAVSSPYFEAFKKAGPSLPPTLHALPVPPHSVSFPSLLAWYSPSTLFTACAVCVCLLPRPFSLLPLLLFGNFLNPRLIYLLSLSPSSHSLLPLTLFFLPLSLLKLSPSSYPLPLTLSFLLLSPSSYSLLHLTLSFLLLSPSSYSLLPLTLSFLLLSPSSYSLLPLTLSFLYSLRLIFPPGIEVLFCFNDHDEIVLGNLGRFADKQLKSIEVVEPPKELIDKLEEKKEGEDKEEKEDSAPSMSEEEVHFSLVLLSISSQDAEQAADELDERSPWQASV